MVMFLSHRAHSSLNVQDFLFAIDAEGVPADKVTREVGDWMGSRTTVKTVVSNVLFGALLIPIR